MPKLAVVLGRRTLNVFELDRPRISIGRSPDTDIPIDNVSVSRQHAEIFRTDDGWMVRDTNSSNGTFLNGERLTQPRPLKRGDEIAIGKFSIFFDRILGDSKEAKTRPTLRDSQPVTEPTTPQPTTPQVEEEAAPEPQAPPPPPPPSPSPDQPPASGTRFIKPQEVEDLRKASAERRKAKITWQGGGQSGEEILPDSGCLLIGKSELCDVRTPAGPKHHLLLSRLGDHWEVRNLSWWHGMKVNGAKRARVGLSDGDTVELGGLSVTYQAAVD